VSGRAAGGITHSFNRRTRDVTFLTRRNLGPRTLAIGVPVAAQERASTPFKALEALNASYDKQLHDLECRRIADLAALAEKSPGPEADAAYRHVFGLAIADVRARNVTDGDALEAFFSGLGNALDTMTHTC
jgi:hypothetical protein